MTNVSSLLHRYVAPFLMGMCMAATTVASGFVSLAALVVAAAALGFFSLPAGGRMIARFTQAAT